jgi:hypothetical protein
MIAQHVSEPVQSPSTWQRRPIVHDASATQLVPPPAMPMPPQHASLLAQSSGPSHVSDAPMQSPGAVHVSDTIMPPLLRVAQQISPEPHVALPHATPTTRPPSTSIDPSVPLVLPESRSVVLPSVVLPSVVLPESVLAPSARGPESGVSPPESSLAVVVLPQPTTRRPAKQSTAPKRRTTSHLNPTRVRDASDRRSGWSRSTRAVEWPRR